MRFKGNILRACKALLASNEKGFPVIGLLVEILRGKVSLKLNGKFDKSGVHGMLEEKGNYSTDMGFAFFVRLWTRFLDITEDE